MKHFAIPLLLSAAALSFALPAQGQVFVQSSGKPFSCFQAVKTGDLGSISAIRTCTEALSDYTVLADVPATRVNRGVLYMRKGKIDKAIEDYRAAIRLQPDLAEAHINLGAAYYYNGDDMAALRAINTALDMGTEKRAEALFNRALVHDRMEDAKAAYYDLKEVLELRPDWEEAQSAIARYTVTRRTT